MFVTWKRRRLLSRGYVGTWCRHAPESVDPTSPERQRFMPVVMFSYKDGAGVPRHYTIWRPRVGINSCCLDDLQARERFWKEVESRIEELRRPPLNESSGAILLDRLDWLRSVLAEKVRPVSDDEYAELFEEQLRGGRNEEGSLSSPVAGGSRVR